MLTMNELSNFFNPTYSSVNQEEGLFYIGHIPGKPSKPSNNFYLIHYTTELDRPVHTTGLRAADLPLYPGPKFFLRLASNRTPPSPSFCLASRVEAFPTQASLASLWTDVFHSPSRLSRTGPCSVIFDGTSCMYVTYQHSSGLNMQHFHRVLITLF